MNTSGGIKRGELHMVSAANEPKCFTVYTTEAGKAKITVLTVTNGYDAIHFRSVDVRARVNKLIQDTEALMNARIACHDLHVEGNSDLAKVISLVPKSVIELKMLIAAMKQFATTLPEK